MNFGCGFCVLGTRDPASSFLDAVLQRHDKIDPATSLRFLQDDGW